MVITILPEEDYNSSTMTMVAGLNRSLKTRILAEYMPVVHLFNNKGERVKIDPGTRDGITFFGSNGIIITSCYKDIRRGIRLGAMSNMICSDLQILNRNVHIKISGGIITSVGTSDYESGKLAFNCVIDLLNTLNDNIIYLRLLPETDFRIVMKWIINNCVSNGELKRLSEISLPFHVDNRAILIAISYIDDFERHEISKFVAKINKIRTLDNIFEGRLNNVNPKIYNSVYHIKMCDTKERISLHKMAPYLKDKGVAVEFHNWTSEGVNICYPIENELLGSSNKEYKHRFTIHEKSSMRQCSPAFKSESYKYYKRIMTLIKEFIDAGQVYDFKKYISEDQLII
jgi:hypothetical protein